MRQIQPSRQGRDPSGARLRRQHQPHVESNLTRWSANLVPPDQFAMQNLGNFGESVADDFDLIASTATAEGSGGVELNDRFDASRAVKRSLNGSPFAMAAPMEAAPTPTDGAAPLVQPTVRSEFADTALWVASLDTNADGLVVNARIAIRPTK